MGTFTATYFLKTAFWDKRGLWTATLAVAYFARCWENAGYHKAEMMKVSSRLSGPNSKVFILNSLQGHSRMFADRQKQLPPHSDLWKY
ncbi:hypothetical protein CAEBREN_10454 [Caenorhabditis brenneri]|uniref:Uncharacterized protein n=1 Tax=Caenorhabditis brenneri TaxID=135651 RepID=G0MCQ2_CAEBE|nr:hypothetical protein CAEBREN_10454 [Caenorhabditis brenneri]